MLPIKAGELVPFTPEIYSAEAREKAEKEGKDTTRFDNPPVYYLSVPTVAQRARLQGDVIAAGATYPSEEEMKEALIDTVREIIEPDQQEEIIGIIEEAMDDSEDVALLKKFRQIERKLRPVSPVYSMLCAARVEYNVLFPLLATQMFLKRADNVEGFVPEFSGGKLTEDCMSVIPLMERQMIGWRAIHLTSLDRGQEKNSDSPS